MKSFFALAFCLLSSAVAQCSDKPVADLDVYVVMDTRQNASVTGRRTQIAAGIHEASEWYSEAGKEVRGSMARAHNVGCASCLHADGNARSVSTLISNIEGASNAVCAGHNDEPTVFDALIYRQNMDWVEPAKRSVVRRVMLTITGGLPLNSEKLFSLVWSRGSNYACPVNTYGTFAQHKVGLQRTGAGLGVIVSARNSPIYSSEEVYNAWNEYAVELGINDFTVRAQPVTNADFTTEVVSVLQLLSCPAYLASTTTGIPRYSTTDRLDCFQQIKSRCPQDSAEASLELNRCLIEIEVRQASN